MFPQFGATAESLSKASSLVFRIGSDAHLYDDPEDVNIAPLLDSKFDSEKSEALKRLLALIAQGFDVSNFFPQVVKNVASQSLEVKKLVYLYLLHYAEKRPNEALLSINCFQKDLSDTNPLVRAWALRAMAGIRLHAIAPLVLVAATKCSRDAAPYVRKCAANALSKINDLRMEENVLALEELVGVLLSDNSAGVIGAAAAAFNSVCPNNLAMIGKNFRHLCETLPDVEEWGQIILIGIILRYVISRHGIVRESLLGFSCSDQNFSFEEGTAEERVISSHDFSYDGRQGSISSIFGSLLRCYIQWPSEHSSHSNYTSNIVAELKPALLTTSQNDDVKILLQCTSPLLWSQNSAVVLAAAAVHWIMAPIGDVNRIVKPILFILRSSSSSKYVILCNIQVFAKVMPSLFAPYFEDFFISSTEPYEIKALKLEILSVLASEPSIQSILQEFQDYVKDLDRRFAANAVAAIGICAQRLPTVAESCMEGLLALIKQESSMDGWDPTGCEARVLTQAVMSVKTIIEKNPALYEKVIIQLARTLDSIKVSAVRALIVWIVGEYNSVGQKISSILPTVFQYLACCFSLEELETKLQIINSTAKIVLLAAREDLSTFKMILTYILELAKCDSHYDVRDRARTVGKLLFQMASQSNGDDIPYIQYAGVGQDILGRLFSRRTKSTSDKPYNIRFYLPGSLSQVVLHAAPGYGPLPKPCSLLSLELATVLNQQAANSDSFETNVSDTSSTPSNKESDSDYSSNNSSSADSENSGPESDASNDNNVVEPLIHLSDAGYDGDGQNQKASSTPELANLMSNVAFESWLDEQSSFSDTGLCQQEAASSSSARIAIKDVGVKNKPKTQTLLDPTNGNGLRVDYSFSSQTSIISPFLVCVEIFIENNSTALLTKIAVKSEESVRNSEYPVEAPNMHESLETTQDVPTLIPVEEIESLEPGQKTMKLLQARFHHHLLPIKMIVTCDGNKYPVKLWPDIGYFIRPLSMDLDTFTKKESQLPGMFEYSRRCTFREHLENSIDKDPSVNDDKFLLVCRSLASKMLNNANIFLVSVDMPIAAKLEDTSGLCLRFCAEILSNTFPCLITLTVLEGKCSEPLDIMVKVNCEETVFGLNLLNRIVAFLT